MLKSSQDTLTDMLRIMSDQISRYVVAQSGWHVKWTITVVLVYMKHKIKPQFPRGARVFFYQDPCVFPLALSAQVFQLCFPSCHHFQLFVQRHKAELYKVTWDICLLLWEAVAIYYSCKKDYLPSWEYQIVGRLPWRNIRHSCCCSDLS